MDTDLANAFVQLEQVLLDLFPAQSRARAAAAVQELRVGVARLAVEVLDAERRGIRYATAVRRQEDFPLMARVHFGVLDLLQHELTPLESNLVAGVCGAAPSIDDGPIRKAVIELAASTALSAQSSLARFALYQLTRLGIWTTTWSESAGQVEATGAFDSLDDKAEILVRRRLLAAPLVSKGEDPIRLLVLEALLHLHAVYGSRMLSLRRAVRDSVERFETLAKAFETARQLAAPEAAIVRNSLGSEFGHIPLGSKRLARQHPLLFGTASAVDQRRHRMLAAAKAAGGAQSLRAKQRRLIDVLRGATNELAQGHEQI